MFRRRRRRRRSACTCEASRTRSRTARRRRRRLTTSRTRRLIRDSCSWRGVLNRRSRAGSTSATMQKGHVPIASQSTTKWGYSGAANSAAVVVASAIATLGEAACTTTPYLERFVLATTGVQRASCTGTQPRSASVQRLPRPTTNVRNLLWRRSRTTRQLVRALRLAAQFQQAGIVALTARSCRSTADSVCPGGSRLTTSHFLNNQC